MIPKPLNEIEWSDIEALRDSGREEDDTIEYKASFSGGSDYLEFNDAKRAKAIEGIAREVVAFLNGRGGDVIIGVREAANDHPKIEEITPIRNIDQTIDRLGQSLAALIEPMQSVLALRAIRHEDGDADGVVVIRCPSSLRAPHRFTQDRQCYIRRGRASVPMPMDEVQDLTIVRTYRRNERLDLLNAKSREIENNRFGTHQLPESRVHFRCVYVPFQSVEMPIDDSILMRFAGSSPTVYCGQHQLTNDVAFQNWSRNWKPTVRGKVAADLTEFSGNTAFIAKDIRQTGVLTTDMADKFVIPNNGTETLGVYYDWVVGFLANSVVSIKNVLESRPQYLGGLVQLSVLITAGQNLIVGRNHWSRAHLFIEGLTVFPYFELSDTAELDAVFQQMQIDVCSLAALDSGPPYSLIQPLP
jgi:Putative DNA-binding domain